MRILLWQQAMSRGMLSSGSSDRSMTFTFPAQVTKDLLRWMILFSVEDLIPLGRDQVKLPLSQNKDYSNSKIASKAIRNSQHPRRCNPVQPPTVQQRPSKTRTSRFPTWALPDNLALVGVRLFIQLDAPREDC
jgi:hypothetical protein